MERVKKSTIDFFNLQVRNLKELASSSKQRTTVTLVTFGGGDGEFVARVDDPILWMKPIEKLNELTEKSYEPRQQIMFPPIMANNRYESAARLGGLAAEADDRVVESLANYGKSVGMS